MKKNRKLVASTIAGLSTLSIVAPIALIASSCSCSCSSGGESVLDGVYTPSFNTFTNDPFAAPTINVTSGEAEYIKAASQNKKMPYEEYKWMWSCIGEYMKFGINLISEQEEGIPADIIKIENLNVKLSNFKFNNVNENRASYNVAGLIDVSINLDSSKFEAWPVIYKWMKTLNGRVKLGWDHKVTNMPLGVFDIGTSNIKNAFNAKLNNTFGEQGLEDLPWTEKTLWFIAPDMSQVAFNDPSWRLDYNFSIDADVELNGNKIVDEANNYNFKFDKTMAGTIEALVQEMSKSDHPELIAYIIERFIPLAAGWMSYYLCNTQHYDHIVGIGDGLGWQTYHEENIAFTRMGQPATFKYELADPLDTSVPVDEQMLTFVVGVKAGDWIDNLFNKQMPFTVVQNVECKTGKPIKEGDRYFLNTQFDWAGALQKNRPAWGYTTADDPAGPAALIPLVMTKKWISFGEPFILTEGKDFWDDYPAHNEQEGGNTLQIMDAMGVTNGATTLTFGISKEVYDDMQKTNKRSDYVISVVNSGQIQGQAAVSDDKSNPWKERKVDDNHYFVDVPVIVPDWTTETKTDATSAPFYVSVTNTEIGATLKSGYFQIVKGNPIRWNSLCDFSNKNIAIPPKDSEIEVKNAIECASSVTGPLEASITPTVSFVDSISVTPHANGFYDLKIKLKNQKRQDATNLTLTIEDKTGGAKVQINNFAITTKYEDIDWRPELAFEDQTFTLPTTDVKEGRTTVNVTDGLCVSNTSYLPLEGYAEVSAETSEPLEDIRFYVIRQEGKDENDPCLDLIIDYAPNLIEGWDTEPKQVTLRLSWYDMKYVYHESTISFYVQKEQPLKK